MFSPLSTRTDSSINSAASHTSSHRPVSLSASSISMDDEAVDVPSSPFLADVSNHVAKEGAHIDSLQHKQSHVSPVSSPKIDNETPLSPLKLLKNRPPSSPSKSAAETRASRRVSGAPIKRFPVKVSTSSQSSQEPATPREMTTQMELPSGKGDAGMARAIQILEDEESVLDYGIPLHIADDTDINEDFADETAFSTFSAVPDMTMFAKLGHAPSTFSQLAQARTPRPQSMTTPATARRQAHEIEDDSPTPRKPSGGDSTMNLLDFTTQFNSLSQNPQSLAHGRSSPTKSGPELLSHIQNARAPSPSKFRNDLATPSHNRMSHLLDFDIPPAPTPRSMPSITPRELESLKSGFLSQISNLKATLSGKEAEVHSLKTAVGDAEKRVGDCMEMLSEERNEKEQLAVEKELWEKRGNEVESVLRNVKEEMENIERERESLEGRLQESEMRREAAELMAQEAESKMAGMRAGSSSLSSSLSDGPKSTTSSREIEIAVEKVARELHTLYKGKHETKVAALKRSYESKWDRKVKDLEDKVEDLSKENDHLRAGNTATMSKVLPARQDTQHELQLQANIDAKHVKELQAKMDGMAAEMRSIRHESDDLRSQLETERLEKGELVAACDELLALQQQEPITQQSTTQQSLSSAPPQFNRRTSETTFRTSITEKRISGLRAPGKYTSGLPGPSSTASPARPAGGPDRLERHKSGSSQGSRPGSGHGGLPRGSFASGGEKMGLYKGRGEV